MKRSKVLLIACMTLAAAVGGFVVAGEAMADDWHDYKGRLAAGHAYLVPVPAKADALQVRLVDPAEGATARVVLYSPTDERVAHYTLSNEWPSATITKPTEGGYVIYTYALEGGALGLRLQGGGKNVANGLDLERLKTAREDRVLLHYADETPLKEIVTAKYARAPLFLSLLYQGSVENLAATVSSPEGEVMRITGESGTAYAPGLWSAVSGERDSFPEKLQGARFEVKAQADGFQGTLYLTSLEYQRVVVAEPRQTPRAPGAPVPDFPDDDPDATQDDAAAQEAAAKGVRLRQGVPLAVEIDTPGTLIVLATENGRAHRHDRGGEPWDGNDPFGYGGWNGRARAAGEISVFGPDDSLLDVLNLKSGKKTSGATFLAQQPGEYVLYLWPGGARALTVATPGDVDAPTLATRELKLTHDGAEVEFVTAPLGYSVEHAFKLPRAPLGLAALSPDGVAVDFEATFESPSGMAARQRALATGSGWDALGEGELNPAKMVPGAYTFKAQALSMHGSLGILWAFYDRDATLDAEELEEASDDEAADDGDDAADEASDDTAGDEDVGGNATEEPEEAGNAFAPRAPVSRILGALDRGLAAARELIRP